MTILQPSRGGSGGPSAHVNKLGPPQQLLISNMHCAPTHEFVEFMNAMTNQRQSLFYSLCALRLNSSESSLIRNNKL